MKVGAKWRIQAGGCGREPLIRFNSDVGIPAPVFDELCIDDWFHLEQMGARDWYLGLKDIQLNIRVRRDGSLDVMQYGGPDIREGRKP